MKTCFLFLVVLFHNTFASFEKLSQGNHQFTASTYKEAIKETKDNLLISPFSAEVVLALAQSGAKGQTAEEIRSALHLPNTDQEVKAIFGNLLQNFSSENYELHTANKIYLGENFKVIDNYKAVATNTYHSEVENVNFSKSSETANAINQWVEGKTQNKIKNLVDPSSLNSGTAAVLVNALYFRAKWADRDFHKYPIRQRDFYKSGSETVKVDFMMNIGARLNYYEDSTLKARFLKLAFEGEDAHFVIVLPDEIDGLKSLEGKAEEVFKTHPFKPEIVNVNVPLFKIESSIDFKKILAKLGVSEAFTGNADFSGISGQRGISIGQVFQKTYINVTQDGVEAAAATDLIFELMGPPRATKTFTVDRPFLFYLEIKDVILFAGRVVLPKHD